MTLTHYYKTCEQAKLKRDFFSIRMISLICINNPVEVFVKNPDQKIIVMSDVHLTNNGEKIIGLDPVRKLERALDHALCTHGDAVQIVFTGDLAHNGTQEQYSILKEVVRGIDIPITYMMGNHDRREAFAEIFPSVPFNEDGFLQSAVTYDNHKLLFLDTLHVSSFKRDRSKGFLCYKRLRWLESELKYSGQKKVIVFMHHPAFEVGFNAMDKIRLINDNEFFLSLDKHKKVIHLISGHIHRTISGNVRGYGFSVFKSTCHQMPMMFNSDNVKLSSDEPSAYGILLLKDSSVIVHSEDYELSGSQNAIFKSCV